MQSSSTRNFLSKHTTWLFAALCLYFITPFIYTCVRTGLIASVPDTNGLGIAGHIEWFDLINETILAFLTVPLYSILNSVRDDSNKFRTRIWRGFSVSFVLYALFALITAIAAESMAIAMQVNRADIPTVSTYLCFETIGFAVGYAASYAAVIFTVIGKPGYIFAITVARTLATIVGDLVLIPAFGVNGVAFSNIVVNLILAIGCYVILTRENLKPAFEKTGAREPWVLQWIKTGLFSGGQILLDNIIYALIVVRMVNEVAEQGNYWTANNFIWGLLLVPTMALCEIIKRNTDWQSRIRKYMTAAIAIAAVWAVSIPLWKPFLITFMGIEDPSPILKILNVLWPFYIAYNLSAVLSSLFIMLGKTSYNFIVSIIVNIGYYGIVYALFLHRVFEPGITFICCMFGFGMVVNLISTLIIFELYTGIKRPRPVMPQPE